MVGIIYVAIALETRDVKKPQLRGKRDHVCSVAEPSELYGPPVPIIVYQTSDSST
jgi:hypothetical protein